MESIAAPESPAPRGRWPWPPLLKVSAAWHVGAIGFAAAEPALWPWAAGAVVADHALLVATGLWPRSSGLGANLLRLPAAAAARGEVAITLDDGPDPEVTPRVLDLLDAHGARATFFCIARQAARHPGVCREIVARGHSVQNHSDRHAHHFSLLGPAALRRELQAAQDALAAASGELPRYFRAPAGLRNVFLAPVLHALDLALVAWTRRGFDTVRGDPRRVAARLTARLAAGDILLLHDRHSAIGPSGRPVVLDALPRLLQRLAEVGLRSVALPEAMRPAATPPDRGTAP